MEAEVTNMASGSSSNELDTGIRCVTCGIQRVWTPMMWACDVCGDYFLCESCSRKGSSDNSEVPSNPTEVHCLENQPMSAFYRCDGCGTSPIRNLVWDCKACYDFVLCEECHGGWDAKGMTHEEHSKEHPMVSFEVIYPGMLFQRHPSLNKSMDSQWSYKVGRGFKWVKSSSPILKLTEQVNPNSKQVLQADGMLEKKHKVFLSHAGTEKDFVEQLHRDLSRVHHFGVFFDKDDESLPKGELFPERIFDAAKHCKLAIVVISHEYFIRKWPMLELVAFVEAQRNRPELKILPIFYKLTVEEFKKQQELFEGYWMKMGFVSRDGLDEWNEALKVISRTNGLEYDKRMGEVGLRDRIVEAVYKRVNPELMWDDSHVQGKSQMQEMIQEMIQFSRNENGEVLLESTLRMGLFGMGGSGKTTMCKVLCNQMMSHYLGKVCHIEFGDVDPKKVRKMVLKMRMKLLRDVCQLEPKLLCPIDDGQALSLLKTHIPEQRVCMIIDNVSINPSFVEEARTLLNLPFKEGSLIVVTSRSSIILENLNIMERLRMRIPSLTREEAKALFSHHGECDTSSLREEHMKAMEGFVERCNFGVKDMASKEYHPLALKVLGSRVGANPSKWQSIRIDFKHYEDEKKHPIFSILRSSFDTLNLKYQSIFLDIALAYGDTNMNPNLLGLRWRLRCLYGEIDEQFSDEAVEILQAKSLVEYYDVESGNIYVHDLYREFARMEVEKKGLQHNLKCCFSRGSKHGHAVQKGRVRIHDHPVSHITKDILLCAVCLEAELVTIEDCANLISVDVPGMENLKEFDVIGDCPQLASVNLEGAVNLRILNWLNFEGKFYPDLTSWESLEGLWLRNDEAKSAPTPHGCLDFSKKSLLEILDLTYAPLSLLNLNQAVLLKRLAIENCQHLERFEGLEALAHLEEIVLKNCTSLVEFPSLANFPSLVKLGLEGARNLKAIHGFANLIALQELSLHGSRGVEELVGIETCTKLKILILNGTNMRDCSWISTMMDLKDIGLSGTKIKFVPDCSNLCKLFELYLDDCEGMESIVDMTGSILPTFSQRLHRFSARNCRGVNSMPHFHKESMLQYLNLSGTRVEDVYGLTDCKQLEELFCARTLITSLPDLSSLTSLKVLDVSECELLTRLDNIESLPALDDLRVSGCTNLLALPNLESSMALMEFNLFECPLVHPNEVKLPNSSSMDMDMGDVDDTD